MSGMPQSHRRRSPWRHAILAVLPLLLVLPPAPAAAAGTSIDVGELEADCPVEVPEEHAGRVTCGSLTVPERRGEGADPERTIQLPFAVIASRAADPEPDPLVFPTSGGPGGGSLSALGYFLDHAGWASADRDVILLEQRGDQLAEPTLDCPELDPEHFVADGRRLTGDEAAGVGREQTQACHDRLTADGIDLAAYTSAASAADLTDLRRALGYERWNLYGISYGTRLALTAMRDQPDGLRAVVLDGVLPPNVNFLEELPRGLVTAVDALVAACAADDDCHRRYPQLRRTLLEVLDRAAEHPFEVTVTGADGSPVRQRISDTDLVDGLFNALFDPSVVRVLPFLIDRLAQGDAGAIVPLAQSTADAAGWFTEGLDLSVDCAEEVPFTRAEAVDAAVAFDPLLAHYPTGWRSRADCEVWDVPALPATENDPVVSDIPTLLMSGGYDPVTPSAFAEAAATGLSQAYRYDVPAMGHGAVWATWVDDCPASIAQQFLRTPQAEPDATCIDNIPPTDFLTATDIHPTSAVYRLNGAMPHPVFAGIAIALLVLLLGTVGYGVAFALRPSLRRSGDVPDGTVEPAVVSAVANLVFAGALAWIVASTEPLLLAFGLPAGAWPLLLLPFVGLAATALLIVMLVRAWRRGDGSRAHRIALSVSAAACLGFAVLLLSQGLLTL